MAEKSLTERVLEKKILVKEQDAERYIKSNLVIARVRYAGYSKTRPKDYVFFAQPAKLKTDELRREASRDVVILIATGDERLGHIKALVDVKDDGNYYIVNSCIYHIDPNTQVLSIDAIKTEKDYRGKGVGNAVINFAKDIAISSKCSKVELDSVRSATVFYKKMGFEVSEKQVCPDGSLKTMSWNVSGNLNTNNFTINELNLMMQRGRENGKGK